MVVTELQLFTAIKAKIAAANGNWLASKPVHFGRRPPNAAAPPYTIIMVEDTTEPDIESDGSAAQQFDVELAVKATGPDDAAEASDAVTMLDPAWTATSGITLTEAEQDVIAVIPLTGRLRLIAPLANANDQYDSARRWRVCTSALVGA